MRIIMRHYHFKVLKYELYGLTSFYNFINCIIDQYKTIYIFFMYYSTFVGDK